MLTTSTDCDYYNAGACRSCQWLESPYSQQLQRKELQLRQLLSDRDVERWLPSVASDPFAFRNKAKMAVSGTVDQPVLGILRDDQSGVDLSRCPLYADYFYPVFDVLKVFIRKAQLNPYNVDKRKGELKYILLTHSREKNAWMLRFVMRSEALVESIRQRLPWLQENIANLAVVSVNIQAEHKAVIEGDKEILLSENDALRETLNGIPLYISPRSFFQTNTTIAEKLYATAQEWSRTFSPREVWDLFCGIGGFGLHCTPASGVLRGIEISPEAIRSATRSANELGIASLSFSAMDVAAGVDLTRRAPDLLIVNPPRRGIGGPICNWINALQPEHVMYSSCNAESLANDLNAIEGYAISHLQLFDMFPNTSHYEVLLLLRRADLRN